MSGKTPWLGCDNKQVVKVVGVLQRCRGLLKLPEAMAVAGFNREEAEPRAVQMKVHHTLRKAEHDTQTTLPDHVYGGAISYCSSPELRSAASVAGLSNLSFIILSPSCLKFPIEGMSQQSQG